MDPARRTLKTMCRTGIVLGALLGVMHADSVLAGQVAVPNTPLRVNQTADLQVVGPGQPAQTLSGDFDNRNADPVHVGTVTASIASVAKAPGAAAGTCDASDFTLAQRAMRVGADVPTGRGTGAWTGATIRFNDKPGVDQNPCMGATVKLRYTIS